MQSPNVYHHAYSFVAIPSRLIFTFYSWQTKNSTQPRIPVLYKAVLINNSQPFLICSFTGLGLVSDSQNPVLSVFFLYL